MELRRGRVRSVETADRGIGITGTALDVSHRLRARIAVPVIVGALVICWLLAHVLDGAGSVAPHWFYLPVLFAAARFGIAGAATTGVVAGLLAGPFTPLDATTGAVQEPKDWGTRLAFFVLIGIVMARVVAHVRSDLVDEINRLRLADELRTAMGRQEFVVHYQPVVNLASGEVAGCEALIRWQHPERGLVMPPEFIGAAEDSGLIVDLGAQVLNEACHQVALWRSAVLRNRSSFVLAVNVSARQLDDPDWVRKVLAIVTETGIPPEWLHLEITETALVRNMEATAVKLELLRAHGVRVAIDDFGTGHASFHYVQQLPVDLIKIDRTFVAALDTGGRAAALTAGIVRLAHELGIATVGEGIETAAQMTHLRHLGCELGQGFYFAGPDAHDAIERLLARETHFASRVAPVPRVTSRAL